MKKFHNDRNNERGGAPIKVLFVFLVLALSLNAGINYVPVAYDGASFRQEMDTAVVKGLAASGSMKPLEVVKASIQRASFDYNVPTDALVDIKPVNNVVEANISYTRPVSLLPFGLYTYNYNFHHHARPVGYLLKN